MDQKNTIAIINRIENEFDVNAIVYKDTAVWPIVRLYIWNRILESENGYQNKSILKISFWHHLKDAFVRIFCQIAGVFKYIVYVVLLFRFSKQPFPDEKVDIAILSRPEDYTDLFQKKYFNRHIDPIFKEYDRKLKIVKIENFTFNSYMNRKRYYTTCYIRRRSSVSCFIRQLFLKNNELLCIHNLQELLLYLKKLDIDSLFNADDIISCVKSVYGYKNHFEEVLSQIKPKLVLLNCFYSQIGFGLILACKNKMIRVADIQHGKGGKYHVMYTNWSKVPENGYQLLPDYFLVWGHEMKQNILNWQYKSEKSHQPLITGNLWLASWLSEDNYEDLSEDQNRFLDHIKKFEKRILFTLQPIKNPLPSHVIQAIKRSPKSWIWLIRTHPMHKKIMISIKELLYENGCENFDIDISSHIALYSLLKRIDHHVTCWSSVCYESLYFKVPTTIVHNTGLQLYDEYINNNYFSLALNCDDMLRIINKKQKNNIADEQNYYIETNLNSVKNSLNELFYNTTYYRSR